MAGSQSSPVLSPSRYEAMVPWPNIGKVESKNSPSPNDPTAFLPMVVIFMVEVALLFRLSNGRYRTPISPGMTIRLTRLRHPRPCMLGRPLRQVGCGSEAASREAPSRILNPDHGLEIWEPRQTETLLQLLDDPTAGGMLRDVEMHDAAIVADGRDAVEHAEGDRGHGEEVHGRNRFSVIRKKYAPALGWGSFGTRFIQREMVLSETASPA